MNEPGSVRGAVLAVARSVISELGLLVVSFLLMALSVTLEHGHFSFRAIALLLASTFALIGAACRNRTQARAAPSPALEWFVAAGVIVCLITGACAGPGIYYERAGYAQAFVLSSWLLALAVGFAFLWPKVPWRVQRLVFLAGVILGLGLRVGMIIASPRPLIDVFTQYQESAVHLLQGLNPFVTPVTDPWHGRQAFGYQVTGYSYPPASLYAHTLAYLLAGDIRYAYVAFEAVAIGCLYALAAPARRSLAALLVLLFLFHPRAFFVIEQAWNEPLMIGAAAVFLWLRVRRPDSRWVAITLGLFLSLKQYLVFFAVLYLAPRRRWRLLPLVAGVIVLTWLPFLVWDWRSALDNGLWFQFRTGFRTDGLTLSSLFHDWWGWTPTKWVAIGVGTLSAIATGLWFRAGTPSHWLYASLLTTLVVFLFGSQAFCNYYTFLGMLILFLIALRLRETVPQAMASSVDK